MMSTVRDNGDNLALYYFHRGTNNRAYNYMGAHRLDNSDSVSFRVWAPNAKSVSVIGDFNGWDVSASPMSKINDAGVWECYADGVREYDKYKYHIV